MKRSTKALLRTILAAAAATAPAGAQEAAQEAKPGWTDVAEFSYVVTAGNSETQTLGFKNTLKRAWDKSSIEVKAGGIRSESTILERFGVGDPNVPSSIQVRETSTTSLTAENYFLNGRFDRKISGRFFWFVGAGWDRNEFAGVQNRYTGAAGVGNIWVDTENVKFRTDYAVTFTKQEDVVADPNVDDTFLGARLSWDYLHKFGANAAYTNTLVIDENGDETEDLRADMTNSVTVALTKKLALKVSLQWLYDNQPSLKEVDVFLPPFPPGTATGQTVLVELDELDTIFTTSLVINF